MSFSYFRALPTKIGLYSSEFLQQLLKIQIFPSIEQWPIGNNSLEIIFLYFSFSNFFFKYFFCRSPFGYLYFQFFFNVIASELLTSIKYTVPGFEPWSWAICRNHWTRGSQHYCFCVPPKTNCVPHWYKSTQKITGLRLLKSPQGDASLRLGTPELDHSFSPSFSNFQFTFYCGKCEDVILKIKRRNVVAI
jgi:hypothetical protein